MARPLDGKTRDKIVQMYTDNASYTAITRECNVSGPTVTKVAKQAGLPLRKKPAHLRNDKEEPVMQTDSPAAPSSTLPAPVIEGNEAVRQLTPEKKTVSKKAEPSSSPTTSESQEWDCGACGAVMEGDQPKECLNCGAELSA